MFCNDNFNLYMIGGYANYGVPTDQIIMLSNVEMDNNIETFRHIGTKTLPSTLGGFGAISSNNYIILFGGYTGYGTVSNDIYYLSLK